MHRLSSCPSHLPRAAHSLDLRVATGGLPPIGRPNVLHRPVHHPEIPELPVREPTRVLAEGAHKALAAEVAAPGPLVEEVKGRRVQKAPGAAERVAVVAPGRRARPRGPPQRPALVVGQVDAGVARVAGRVGHARAHRVLPLPQRGRVRGVGHEHVQRGLRLEAQPRLPLRPGEGAGGGPVRQRLLVVVAVALQPLLPPVQRQDAQDVGVGGQGHLRLVHDAGPRVGQEPPGHVQGPAAAGPDREDDGRRARLAERQGARARVGGVHRLWIAV